MKKLLRECIREILSENVSYVSLNIKGISFTVEHADTEQLRNKGLMFRESLSHNTGMLFTFPDTDYRSFWMKNTYIPLSIAYLSESGRILNIESMKPLSTRDVNSLGPAKYALEMNYGWFTKNNIKPGDVVSFARQEILR
jgi:uncharacterized membrane protein (UPF0127 family)